MKAKLISRWNGVGRASVAVAGVCLTGSVASAWTTTRAADFETEFEAGQALGTGHAFAGEAPAATAPARILAADAGTTVWEQTLVGYLDKLVTRECDEANKDAAKKSELAASPDAGQKDAEEAGEAIDASTPATGALASKPDANADWDLEEQPIAIAAIDPDWDLAEAPVAVAEGGADWDLEEAPVAVVAASAGADWDLEEPMVVVAAASPDWDLEEATGEDAVTALSREVLDGAPKSTADQNPDWDLDEPTVAAASADEVTKVDSSDDELDLFP